jgi:hypothetical protein
MEIMTSGVILLVLGAIGLMILFYSVFCYAPSDDSRKENENRCVCCGDIIPEGRWVCPNCERKAKEKKDGR